MAPWWLAAVQLISPSPSVMKAGHMTDTSVWTMDKRCERISDTIPRMSTNSCSLMCCIKRSRAMNVPVLPTPALRTHTRHVHHHRAQCKVSQTATKLNFCGAPSCTDRVRTDLQWTMMGSLVLLAC